MKTKRPCLILLSVLATFVVLAVSSDAFAAFASLNNWVGVNNTSNGNNYVVTSSTSAGGTFVDRSPAGSLSDTSITGGPFAFSSPVSMSGTVTYTVPSPPSVDPIWFLGWYNSSNINNRIGLSVANPVPFPGAALRWQTIAVNATNDGTVFKNVNSTNANSTFANGTYSFTFDYDGAGNITGTFDTINFSHALATPADTNLGMDSFGILQPPSSGGQGSFNLEISDINYSGETQIPEPSSLALMVLGIAIAFVALSRR